MSEKPRAKMSRLPPLQSQLLRQLPQLKLAEPENHLQDALRLTMRILDRYQREGRTLSEQETGLLDQIKNHPCCAQPDCFAETAPLDRAANNPNLSPRTQQLIKKLQSAVGAHKVYRDSLVRKSDLDSLISFTHNVMEAAPSWEGLAEPLVQQLQTIIGPDVGNRLQKHRADVSVFFFSESESFLFDPLAKVQEFDRNSAVMRCALSLQQEISAEAAYFPIRSPNACFGAVALTNMSDPLASSQVELIVTSVSIAALYLSRQRLLDSLHWQVDKAEAMLTMAMKLSCENLDSQVLVEGIMSTAKALTESDRCKVFLVQGDSLSYFDNGRSVVMTTMEAGIAGHVAKTGATVNIRDAARDELCSTWGDVDFATGYCIHTMLCMPVFYEKTMVAVAQLINKLDGVDICGNAVKRYFSGRDEELFASFSLFVGVCLRNCRINANLLEEKRKSEAILDVVTLLSNTDIRDVNAILGHVMLGAKKLLSADRTSLFLIDKERNELFSKVADSTGGREIRFPAGKGIAGTVAASGVAENIPDAYVDARFNRDIDKQFGYRTLSILCEPIAVNGEVLAVAQLVNKTLNDGTVTSFTPDDQSTFRTFALFAGISIANSHLLEFAVRAGNEAMALTSMIDASSSQNTPRRSSASPIGTPIIAPVTTFELECIDSVEIAPDVQHNMCSKDFNIFDFNDAHHPKASDASSALVQRLIMSTGLPDQFKCSAATLSHFIVQCRRRYRKVPYHNFFHVVDVCQTIHTFLYEGGTKCYLTDLECFVLLITALVHDLDHMGLNNSFHLKTDSPLGILSSSSGNNSVLEVHHCNLAIEILSDDAANVFKGLSAADVTYAYRCLIDCVLATDMARHEELLRNFSVVWIEGFDKGNEYHRRLLMQMILKAGDISNVTKPFDISRRWAAAVTEEFYQQGDKEKEKGVAVLPMYDRAVSTELARGQIGFINFVAKKFFDLLSDALPSLKWTSERITENREKWASM